MGPGGGRSEVGGTVCAWLVSSSPQIHATGATYASVPVRIAGESAEAGNDQTTLLIPCQALPPGVPPAPTLRHWPARACSSRARVGTRSGHVTHTSWCCAEAAVHTGVQLRFHKVEMQEADLRALCVPGAPAPPPEAAPPAPCRPCKLRAVRLLHRTVESVPLLFCHDRAAQVGLRQLRGRDVCVHAGRQGAQQRCGRRRSTAVGRQRQPQQRQRTRRWRARCRTGGRSRVGWHGRRIARGCAGSAAVPERTAAEACRARGASADAGVRRRLHACAPVVSVLPRVWVAVGGECTVSGCHTDQVQVAFDDLLQATEKRKRESSDSEAAERSDFMSSLLGKRVCVRRRARTALANAHRAAQPAVETSGAAPAAVGPRGGRGAQRREQRSAHTARQQSAPSTAVEALSVRGSDAPRGAAEAGSPRVDPVGSTRMHSFFMGGENNEEEEYAVMGLLRLCEAS